MTIAGLVFASAAIAVTAAAVTNAVVCDADEGSKSLKSYCKVGLRPEVACRTGWLA